ncbi:hypothetical protein [Streptacidiphilus anmyonensis]|uniref:hypothetical protein n=1 Tax=Streptacidiphilus anmyonensis TaxID=405782 RepID=UPI0005A972D9|nr:hypothetical protein [Streptacidiphilus anmyonensis]
MSFNPPGPVPGPQPPRGGADRAGGAGAAVALVGAGAMLLMEALLLLLTLVDAPGHLDALLNLFGLGDHWIDAPTQFTAGDVAICAVLGAGIIGSQGGRTWGRAAIGATMGLVGYPVATSLLDALRTSDGRHAFTLGHNLWFYLIMIIELLIAVGTLVAILVSSRTGAQAGATPVGAGPMPAQAPMPGQGPMSVPGQQPYPQPGPVHAYPQQPAPGYAPPPAQPGYPAQPMPYQQAPHQQAPHQPGPVQQPGGIVPSPVQPPGPVQQPGQGGQPAPGYSPPPVPPQAGPIQQPTPTQEAMAYRPTQYGPPPGGPKGGGQGNPPVPPGA